LLLWLQEHHCCRKENLLGSAERSSGTCWEIFWDLLGDLLGSAGRSSGICWEIFWEICWEGGNLLGDLLGRRKSAGRSSGRSAGKEEICWEVGNLLGSRKSAGKGDTNKKFREIVFMEIT
jgi:hypothetical protein